MPYAYTSDVLISQVQRRGMIPTSSNTLATADFLSFINDEIQTFIVPLLMATREEFFVTSEDVTIVAGTAAYSIPARAIGAKLKDVQQLVGSSYAPLTRLEPERVARDAVDSAGTPAGYYLQANSVVLWPTPSASGTLRLYYFARPNRIVDATTATATIATLPGSGVVTITAAPTSPVFPTASQAYDFIKATGPGFECRAIDKAATRSTTTLTFASVPSNVAVGDYVAIAGETPVPQIPVELHPLLAERVLVRALQALGDPKVADAVASADRMAKSAIHLLTPRVEGSARYVVPRFGPGISNNPWRRP